jgi:tripartite-type tricarboxylate transporter receptor subunit TctC
MKAFSSLPALLLLALSAACGAQESWPGKPVRIIVANPAGSSPDIITRMMADRLAKALGQSFVVDLRPGGQSVVGALAAAKSPADGYTLFLGTNAAMVMNRFLLKEFPYEPERDFVFVGNVIDGAAFAVAVNAAVPARNLPGLVAHSKATPGKLSIGAPSVNAQILGRWMNRHIGMDLPIVQYKEMAQSIQDTVAGRVEVILASHPSIKPHVDAGKLRIVAVSSAKRFPDLPDVPTIDEHYPGLVFAGWWALVAPTGTPQPVIERLNAEIGRVLRDAAFIERVRSFGFTNGEPMTPRELADRARAERVLWDRVLVKELGIKPM